MVFENPTYWSLLWIVALLAVMLILGHRHMVRALAHFAATPTIVRLAPVVNLRRRKLKIAALILAMVAMVVALADPRWGSVWVDRMQRGVDVVFVLDVSRSMLAEDVSPNRLTRAEQYINDMLDAMGADRAALVIYAGDTRQRVPMTRNFSDLRMALEETGPHELPRGGSRLGDGIRAAVQSFVDEIPDHKAIVILADGEDQDSDPIEAARTALGNHGIRVYTVGIGDPAGARIPMAAGRGHLAYEGEPVITRLDSATMEQVAMAGGGAYIPATTRHVDMADVYHRYISRIRQRDFDESRIEQRTPRYQWFIAAALLLVLLDTLWRDHHLQRRGRREVA